MDSSHLFEMDLRTDILTMIRIDQCLPDKEVRGASMTTPTCHNLYSGIQTLPSTSHCMP